jgi:hypothetical protein
VCYQPTYKVNGLAGGCGSVFPLGSFQQGPVPAELELALATSLTSWGAVVPEYDAATVPSDASPASSQVLVIPTADDGFSPWLVGVFAGDGAVCVVDFRCLAALAGGNHSGPTCATSGRPTPCGYVLCVTVARRLTVFFP